MHAYIYVAESFRYNVAILCFFFYEINRKDAGFIAYEASQRGAKERASRMLSFTVFQA